MLLSNLIPIFIFLLANWCTAAIASSEFNFPLEVVTSCGRAVLNECWCLDENWCEFYDSSDVADIIAIVDEGNLLTADRIEENISSKHPNELNIMKSEVDAIDINAFTNFTNLKSINLEHNSISQLPPYVFSKLVNLEFLSLKDNGLRGTKNAFAGLSSLKTLDLSKNPLTDVLDDNCFFGIPKSCDILIESENGFKHIGTDAFGTESSTPDQRHTADHEDSKPKSIHTRSAPLDYGYWNWGRETSNFQICFENNSVLLVDVLKDDNTTSGCKKIDTPHSRLDLEHLGISTFMKGWYRLQDKSKDAWGLSSTLRLANNNISRITKDLVNDLPPYITWLDLKNNKIERLDKGTFEHRTIFSVELNDNLIEEIEEGTFKMPQLYQLFLQGNRLKNTKFVSTLPANLASLHMDYNEITEISPDSFSNLKNLNYLNLDNNKITKLQSQCLLGAEGLGSLILSSNEITTLEKNAFGGVNVVVLTLSQNNITNLERDIFRGLERLRSLNVANNQLKEIRNKTFDLPNLETLNLHDNHISVIERGAAKNLGSLKKLDISNNPIEKLENGALFGLSKTRKTVVRVANAPIRLIQGGVFDDV